MTKLKPQLIVAGPNKKKGGFASGVGYFLILIIVFVLGVYVGMGVNSTDFSDEQLSAMTDKDVSSTDEALSEPRQDTIEPVQQEVVDLDREILDKPVAVNNNDLANSLDESNSEEVILVDSIDEANSPIVISAVGEPSSNGSDVFFDDASKEDLVDQDTYRLQVAAFGSIDQANEVVNDLKLRGYDAYIETSSNSRGEVWNLIKVGKFSTAQEAWNYSTIYQSKEGGEVFVESLSKGRVYNESLEERNDTL